MYAKYFTFPVLLLALVLTGTLYASPIELEADTLSYHQKTGTSIYKGNVKITSGDMVLSGDEVEVFSADGEVSKVISIAKPSRFTQGSGKGSIQGQALKIEYQIEKQLVKFIGDVKIKEGGKIFIGEQAFYDIKKKTFFSRKKKGRIKLILDSKAQKRRPTKARQRTVKKQKPKPVKK